MATEKKSNTPMEPKGKITEMDSSKDTQGGKSSENRSFECPIPKMKSFCPSAIQSQPMMQADQWKQQHVTQSVLELETILSEIVVDFIEDFKTEENEYKALVISKISEQDPQLTSWLNLASMNLNKPVMISASAKPAEVLLDELVNSGWLDVDDRLIFLNMLKNHPQMNAIGMQVINLEFSQLNSQQFITIKKKRVTDCWKLVQKLRARMQSWIDTSCSVWKTSAGTVPFPPVDISEEDLNLIVSFGIPGVNLEMASVQVSNHGACLEIRGENARVENKEYLQKEMPFGTFKRVVPLPMKVEEKGTHATFKDGILTIKLRKMGVSKVNIS